MKFELTPNQDKQVSEWYAAVIEKYESDNGELTNFGAIGGELTYSFTPTSLGVIVVATIKNLGKEINVTDYDMW